MDIPRPRRTRRIRPAYLLAIGAVAVVLATIWLSRLKAAAPEVERATLLVDAVRRGPMLRQVHADGTLVPEDQRIVSALTAGRVEKVLVRPGARVGAGATLVELSNPDVQLEALNAERQLKLAEAAMPRPR